MITTIAIETFISIFFKVFGVKRFNQNTCNSQITSITVLKITVCIFFSSLTSQVDFNKLNSLLSLFNNYFLK